MSVGSPVFGGVQAFRRMMALGLFLLTAIGAAPRAEAQQWARDMFETTSHDFGMVASGSKTHFTFEFKNKYREDVHVAAVRSSCGCTTPSVTKDLLKTGEVGGILATFNTTSFSGQKHATVTVVFDRPYYAEVQLQVSGNIRTEVMFHPAEIAFGEVSGGAEPEREVKVTFSGRKEWRIEDVRSLCPHLRVRLDQPVRRPGAIEYTMRVGLKPSVPVGELHERLTLVTNDAELRSVTVGVTGRVRPQVEVKPDALHLGSLAAGKVASERLLVRADDAFEITEVECDDPRFTFDLPSGAKKVHFVKLNFAADAKSTGAFKLPVRIKTSLSGNSTAECVVTGEVVE